MKLAKMISLFSILFLFIFSTAAIAEGEKNQAPNKETQPDAADHITWMRYDDGLAKAKAENKHVFIDFTAKWCGWCKKMESSTFVDPQVVKMINDNFIAVRVDGDSKDELDIEGYKITERDLTKSEYGVTGYPAFWFLKSDGTKIGQLKGYQQTARFLEALTYVTEKKYEAPTDPPADENNN